MTRDPEDLIASAQDVIGLDAYHIYPDSRHAIPDMVLWGFASACLLEFVKAFVDFKSLGEASRKTLDGLLAAWREKRDFEAYLKSEGVEDAVHAALAATPARVDDAQRRQGIAELTAALKAMGLPADAAGRHAVRIADTLASPA